MIEIDTSNPTEAIDITSRVQAALHEEGIEDCIALIFTLHTTTGLAVNEADPSLISDILNLLERLVPKRGQYLHDRDEGNAHAHLRAMLTGNSVTVPLSEGRLKLGTWQRILFFEFDGPRRGRRIYIKTIPSTVNKK
ncbi:secondary thiamine-phosphate synthase enzyme YjbQ [Methanothrix sp.]|jgi:secondary thiamine-phosphate synthase enzyme|uniref:secondary thiamine-phosphate synthase enzyme YjbQ n=1 Tax=Methanothrix sp. TaxID=90426 RepID=UPI001BD2D703